MLNITSELLHLIDLALSEDLADQDITTDALIQSDLHGEAIILSKSYGVLAGMRVCSAVFDRVESSLDINSLSKDGGNLIPGQPVAKIRGLMGSILRAERTAINFLQRMSAIATVTSSYVQAVQGLPVKIVDTRKTLPGHRALDKYSVRVGGGHNHRLNLASGILIKDNHIAVLRSNGRTIGDAVRLSVAHAAHTLKVEVEVESIEDALDALEAGAHILLLDNMNLQTMKAIVELARGRAITEASGGVTLESVRSIAETGVDLISVGAITHSVSAIDMSLEVQG
jgi:nicotinate-nucleotide pyrophosphorylase (carboxylating)